MPMLSTAFSVVFYYSDFGITISVILQSCVEMPVYFFFEVLVVSVALTTQLQAFTQKPAEND